jgi:hypothetical protein
MRWTGSHHYQAHERDGRRTAAHPSHGAGLGSTMPAAQTMVQWAAGVERLGVATAAVSFSRSIGGVMGAAMASAVLLSALQIADPNAPAILSQELHASSPAKRPVETSPADHQRLQNLDPVTRTVQRLAAFSNQWSRTAGIVT